MRALRPSKHTLPLGLALIAFVAIGVPALAAPRTEPVVGSVATTIGHGVIRAVDATMVDSVDTRAGRADRHAPRNHGLPHLLGPAHFALAVLLLGTTKIRASGPAAVTRLRNSIGRRAPPALAAH